MVTSNVLGGARDILPHVQLPAAIHRQKSDLEPLPHHVLADFQNRGVFDGGGDDVPPLRIGAGDAGDRPVVAFFRGARSEGDLVGTDAAEQRRNFPAASWMRGAAPRVVIGRAWIEKPVGQNGCIAATTSGSAAWWRLIGVNQGPIRLVQSG